MRGALHSHRLPPAEWGGRVDQRRLSLVRRGSAGGVCSLIDVEARWLRGPLSDGTEVAGFSYAILALPDAVISTQRKGTYYDERRGRRPHGPTPDWSRWA
jgi:hypothetical protein